MSETLLYTLIITAAALIIGFFVWRNKRTKARSMDGDIYDALSDIGIAKHLANFKHFTTTPKGCKVSSVVPVPSSALEDIDIGIAKQIVRHNAKYPTWDKFKSISDYTVLFIEPMATNVETEPGSPAIKVKGIQTAGTCIGRDAGSIPQFAVVAPHQEKSNWSYREYLVNTMWFESEHLRESQNSFDVWASYTGANDEHPHVP